ncbi:Magnesium transporter MRS2/LPE10 [Macleaya cordata]|uniref:Magnesium transporter n=1 Tax=Macleaya cordata TaxID=56857 RepID=A0A200Q0H3_MACCD|nr:Magnesium transporter MRS2/LPE10 [Macleaya cordata]
MDSIRNAASGGGGGIGSHKKKAAGVRAWLLIDTIGDAQIVEEERQSIMRRTDPSVIKFVADLQIRLLRFQSATTIQEGSVSSDETGSGNSICNSHDDLMRSRIDQGPSKYSLGFQNGQMVLPYEFIVLEACLQAACSSLEDEATTLELEAHPALDKLASKISTLNLERVRQIKSRLLMISGRVQKVRDELESLLDDDEDMAEMYLTHKGMKKHLDGSCLSSASSQSENNDIDDEFFQPDMDDRTTEISLVGNDIPNDYEGNLSNIDAQDHFLAIQNSIRGDSNRSNTSITPSVFSEQLDVEELEMLLEAYFLQIDGTLNKLSTLREYVDDTEDYINIMLDDKQNQLLKFWVMLATGTLVLNVFGNVFGTLGMQIKIELFNNVNGSGRPEFWWFASAGTAGSIIMYVLAIAWCKHKGLA